MNPRVKPGIVLLCLVAAMSPAWAGPPPPASGSEARYGCPLGFADPDDPFQAFRWGAGLYLPNRWLLPAGAHQLQIQTNYDLDLGVVLLSYQANGREILPAYPLSLEEYGYRAFPIEMRRLWLQGNQRVVARAAGAGTNEPTISVSLPWEVPFTEKLFGKGAPNLTVSGSERITVAGTSSWVVGQKDTEHGGSSIFPKLDMRQQLNVNLNGTIGSKLHIDIAQNSEALTPLENAIRIRYIGEEDEIVQRVELGNTNLNLPGTEIVSFSARQEGLFGVKTEAQVGSVGITAIASRQQGEPGQTTITGGNSEQNGTISDLEIVRGRYFFLSDPDSACIPHITPGAIHVYLDDRDPTNNVERGAISAYVYKDPDRPEETPEPYLGHFHILDPQQDYVIHNDDNYALPVLEIRSFLSDQQVLAVAYQDTILDVNCRSTGVLHHVGDYEVAPGDTLIDLKMIRPPVSAYQQGGNTLLGSPWTPVRRLELKNVYNLRARNIDPASFELEIVNVALANPTSSLKNWEGREIPFTQVLGLDQRNNVDASLTPDGRVDPEYVDYGEGLLFFPDLRPFDPSSADVFGNRYRGRSWPTSPNATRPDTLGWQGNGQPSPDDVRAAETVPEIYDNKPDDLSSRAGQYHVYDIRTRFRTAVSTISLNALGAVLEGSETVRLNGNILTRGTDYRIDYDQGIVELLNPEASVPGADLVITFSVDSPFSRGSRSLVGASLEYKGNANYRYSTSWLTESRGVPERRPRLGQEPTRTTVGDVSGEWHVNPWGLTSLTNKIPLVRTTAPSRLDLVGAMGFSFPNPNTKDEGDVYVDDMEGAEQVTSAPTSRASWSYSSAPIATPVLQPDSSFVPGFAPPDTSRGKLIWFSPQTVQASDLKPDLGPAERNEAVSVLEILYTPNPKKSPQDSTSWGGLVTSIAPLGTDLSQTQFLEVWINDFVPYSDRQRRYGELRVDVGSVSEDAVWDPRVPPQPANGKLDYEDKDQSLGLIGASEDTGLDGIFSDTEIQRGLYDPSRLGSTPADPDGDNRRENVENAKKEDTVAEKWLKFDKLNGAEDNQLADSEALDYDFDLQTSNNYFEYVFNLADSAYVDVTRDYRGVLDPRNGWRLYRVPIGANLAYTAGAPDPYHIQHLRVWFRGVDPQDTLDVQIGSIEIIGNRWERSPVLDNGTALGLDDLDAIGTKFNVGVVNNKSNPEYRPPFQPEIRDRVEEKEQSVSLEFSNLYPGFEASAYRTFPDARDYTLYQDIRFYVNPDSIFDPVEFYVRFGSNGSADSLSYYELATTIRRGDPRLTPSGWLSVEIPVQEMSQVKVGVSAVQPDSFLVGPYDDPPDSSGRVPRLDLGDGIYLTVRGLPSMSQVRRISAGIRNRNDLVIPGGRVWFDELRMGRVRRESGWIARASATLGLADFASITGAIQSQDEDFVHLGQARGSGNRTKRYSLGATVNLNKFVENQNLNLPLRYSLARSRSVPKFFANSDVEFTGVNTGRDITESGQEDITLGISRIPRGRSSFLLRNTVDAVGITAATSKQYNIGSSRVDSTRLQSVGVGYNLSPQVRPLNLMGLMNFSPAPRTLGLRWNRSEARRQAYSRDQIDAAVLKLTNSDTTQTGTLDFSTSFNPIDILTWNYGSTNDLIDEHFSGERVAQDRPPKSLFGLNVGREVSNSSTLNANYSPPFGGWLRPRLNAQGSYIQSYAPTLTRDTYDHAARNVSNSNNLGLALTIPIGRVINTWIVGAGKTDLGSQQQQQPEQIQDRARVARNEVAERAKRQQAEQRIRKEIADLEGEGKEVPDSLTAALESVTSTAAPDTANAGPENQKRKKKGEGIKLRAFFTQVVKLGDVQASGSWQRRSSFNGIWGSPDLAYKMGIAQDVGPAVAPVTNNTTGDPEAPGVSILNTSEGKTQTFRGSTTATVFNRVNVDFNYQTRNDDSETNHTNSVNKDTTWPDIRFTWGDLYKYVPFIRTLFTDFRAVSTSYQVQTTTKGTRMDPEQNVIRNSRWQPLIRIEGTLKGNWRTRLSLDTTSGQTVTRYTGSTSTTSERNSLAIAGNFAKTFVRKGTGGNKNIDYALDFTYRRNDNLTKRDDGRIAQQRQDDDLQVRNSATVRFTRTISGTFGFNLGQTRDITADRTTRSIGISFATGFNF